MNLSKRGESYHRERGENEGLDEADENFKTEEWERGDVGNEEDDNCEKDFAGENISEQPEGKRDYFWNFADNFQNPLEGINRAFYAYEFADMMFESDVKESR